MNGIDRPTPNSARAVRIYTIAPERLLSAFRRSIERLPRWSAGPSGPGEIRAVRTTRLFRFRDDVKILVRARGSGAEAELTSASRIGKGDLGQNPRNIEELLRAVAREIEGHDTPTSPG